MFLSQPQSGPYLVDPDHPLAKHIRFMWIAGAGDVDLINRKVGVKEGSVYSAEVARGLGKFKQFVPDPSVTGAGGHAVNFGGGSAYDFRGLSNQTIFAEVYIEDSATAGGYICGRVSSQWDYSLEISSQQIHFGTGGHAGGQAVAFPVTGVADGLLPHQKRRLPICGTYDKVTAKIYVDGVLKNSKPLSTSFPLSTDPFALGGRGGGQPSGKNFSVSFLILFDTTLSAEWAASISANPSQLLIDEDEHDELMFSSAAAPTGLTSAASCAATAAASLSSSVSLASSGAAQVAASAGLTTAITLAGAAACAAASSAALSSAIILNSTAGGQASSSGGLTTSISLAGSAAGAALVTGALSSGAGLEATCAAQASASASLSTSIPLSSSGAAVASASAALTTKVALVGSGAAAASTAASLSTSVRLQGAAAANSAAAGALATQVSLAGSATCAAAVSASLFVSGQITSAGVLVGVVASASLTTAITLAGAAPGQAAALSALSTQIPLQGSVQTVAVVSGALAAAAGNPLAGAASVQSLVASNLSTQIRLSGAAYQLVSASASFGDARGPILQPNGRYPVRTRAKVSIGPGHPRVGRPKPLIG